MQDQTVYYQIVKADDSNYIISLVYSDYSKTLINNLKDQVIDIFYIAFVDNHLVGSYTSGLIESAIDSRNKPKIGLDQAFIETEKLVSGK